MNCDVAERELSARLDDRTDAALAGAVASHVATCARCRDFEDRARRLRALARLEVAEPVPDLVGRVIGEIRADPRRARVLRLPRRAPADRVRYAAAFLAGALASALVVGGPRGGAPVASAAVPHLVERAGRAVTGYVATFDVREVGFHRLVSERLLEATVTFRAPERFRAAVRDLTAYPSPEWPRNDTTLVVDGSRWHSEGPAPCARETLPACSGRRTRSVRGRAPFDADGPLPTDIVVPVRTLAGTDRVEVVGREQVAGRGAVVVSMPYRDALPLFAYLHAAGMWRPFHPLDRVLVSLDERTSFPLAYRVHPTASSERERWAARNGVDADGVGGPIFDVRARTLSDAPGAWEPSPDDPLAFDAGFRDEARPDAVAPADAAGLIRYREGTTGAGDALVSFARGLTWLTISQTRTWSQPALYGDLGVAPERVGLPGGGVAYYEPATTARGRRLAIHARGIDLYLETNLTRERLLAVAATLPVRGRPVPDAWRVRTWPGGIVREQTTVAAATRGRPWARLPRTLPPGYRPVAAHVVRVTRDEGVTIFFRRPGAEMDGVGIRLHQAAGQGLPPPLEPDVYAVAVGASRGRYSAVRGELEWVSGGVYRSLSGAGLGLRHLLPVAESLGRAGGDR